MLILALYDTLEYAYCYDDEKRKALREYLIHRIWRERNGNSTTAEIPDGVTETTRLLYGDDRLVASEEIALETFDGYERLVTSEETTRFLDDSERLDEIALETSQATCNPLPTIVENGAPLTDDDDDDAMIELERQSS